MRQTFTTLLELVGMLLLAYGFYLAWHPLGYITGGIAVVAVGYLVSLDAPQGPENGE